MTKLNIKDIPIEQITPDANQPRKYFNAEKMKTLIKSIKSYGIKQPLIVQEVGKDKYLISVGERRYRAAKELKLDTVPCLVEAAKSETERLVEQFNVEEQHEQWTPVEKAVAISTLSDKMGLSLMDTCKLLNVAGQDVRRYAAFAELADKSTWVKNEVPLDMAYGLRSLKSVTKKLMENELEEQFTRGDEKKMEHRIVDLIKSGDIKSRGDLARLKDSFTKKPASIKEFMSTKATPDELYHSSKARGAYLLRNCHTHAAWVHSHGDAFLKLRDVKITAEQQQTFERAAATLKRLIDIS